MAKATRELVRALRVTADRIASGSRYQWTHMGACNCGHLAQTVTELSPATIHSYAIEKEGEWADQAFDHCPSSGYRMDAILAALMDLGLSSSDIANLERLNDRKVLRRLGELASVIDFKNQEHVVRYLHAWADLLEEQRLGYERNVASQRGDVDGADPAGSVPERKAEPVL